MQIKAVCPHCRASYRVDRKFIGRTMACLRAGCKKSFVVQDGENPVEADREDPSIQCPNCWSHFLVKPEWAGQTCRCPHCEQPVPVPTSAEFPSTSTEIPILSPPGNKKGLHKKYTCLNCKEPFFTALDKVICPTCTGKGTEPHAEMVNDFSDLSRKVNADNRRDSVEFPEPGEDRPGKVLLRAGRIFFRRRIHWSAYVLGSFWIVFGFFMAFGCIYAMTKVNGLAADFYFVVGTVVFFYAATQAYRLMMDEVHFGTIHLPSTEETDGRD